MTQAKIVFGDAARMQMMRGADALASVVKVTLGPRGRNVLLDTGLDGPQVTNNGARIAERIEFSDRFENMGARLLREVAVETGAAAGAGSTTATVLANSILRGGIGAVGDQRGACGDGEVDVCAGAVRDRLDRRRDRGGTEAGSMIGWRRSAACGSTAAMSRAISSPTKQT